jgi:hypothetical protein
MLHKDMSGPSGTVGPVVADKPLAPNYDLEFAWFRQLLALVLWEVSSP